MYRKIGYAAVDWADACQWERVSSLDQCRLMPQTSVGYVWQNKQERVVVVVYSTSHDGAVFDAIAIPECWVVRIQRLKEVVNAKR